MWHYGQMLSTSITPQIRAIRWPDMICLYSYPAKETPLKQAVGPMVDNLDNGQIGFDPSDLDATEHIEAMLPRGFLRSIGVSLYQILQLSSVLEQTCASNWKTFAEV